MTEQNKKDKPGRINGKNSEYRSGTHSLPKKIRNEIYTILSQHWKDAARKDKQVGSGTMMKRRSVILGFYRDLFHLKYKIESVHNLKQKHLIAVFNFLEDQGQSPSTIQNKISIMRVFCEWIGKVGMVGDSADYVKNRNSVRRSMVVKEDKSWDGHGIDIVSKIQEISQIDQAVGLWLELCLGFGLRVKEALLFIASVAHEGNHIFVREGTKGGRSRIVPVENDMQRDILHRVKSVADGKSGLLGVRGKTLIQKNRRFYYVLKRCGVTLAELGVSAHGLRHQYMQQSYKLLLGVEAPVRGGDINQVDKVKFHIVGQKLAERAGHSRATIGVSYYGSRRRARKIIN